MNLPSLAASIALILPMSIGFADTDATSFDPETLPKVACTDFKFSEAFLSKYPQAPGACIEGRIKDGISYARFNAKVYISSRAFMTVQLLDRAGNTVTTFSFKPAPGARVHVNGKGERFADVEPGEELTLWVPEGLMEVRALPASTESHWVILPPLSK